MFDYNKRDEAGSNPLPSLVFFLAGDYHDIIIIITTTTVMGLDDYMYLV
jgi:hypothetical protein